MNYCGLDIGTQGARCVVAADAGEVLAEGEGAFACQRVGGLPDGWFEQDPGHWLEALKQAVRGALDQLAGAGHAADSIAAVSVTSTSGTLCAVDLDGRPVCAAIMYSDSRSADEARAAQEAGAAVAGALGYRFGASFGLPKIMWLKAHRPEAFARAAWMISPTDFVIGRLTGSWGRSDQTNALKFGYDLLRDRWPDYIESDLGLSVDLLPRVQRTGEPAGVLLKARAGELGLPAGIPVAAGLTDGCASQISSGAVLPGEYNTTIGTTLVVKGVSENLLVDPLGRIYCHRHPDGHWLPGGASNTGAECLARSFAAEDMEALDAAAARISPTDLVAYPLVGTGERFPFRCDEAVGFLVGTAGSRQETFAAYLEGVACLERMALEMIADELGGSVGRRIYSAGGGARSEIWLQIRADTLDRTVVRPTATGGAMGAAIVAASLARSETVTRSARRMVRVDREVAPREALKSAYNEKYGRFVDECRRRGYLG
jgi:xylulokinase